MEHGAPSSHSRNSKLRDVYRTTRNTPPTSEPWPSPDFLPPPRISGYTQAQPRMSNQGQESYPLTCHPAQRSHIDNGHRIGGLEMNQKGQDRGIGERYCTSSYSKNNTLYMGCEHLCRKSPYSDTESSYRQRSPGQKESHQKASFYNEYHEFCPKGSNEQLFQNQRSSKNPPRLASPISWNDSRFQRPISSPPANQSFRYTESQRTCNDPLKGLRDEAGTPISMSEYMFNEIKSQQKSPHTPPRQNIRATSHENQRYDSSQIQTIVRPTTLSTSRQEFRKYRHPDSTLSRNVRQSAIQHEPLVKESPQLLAHTAEYAPQPPSTPVKNETCLSPQPKFTFMDKWLRQVQIKRKCQSDTNDSRCVEVGGLPTTGIVFQERKPFPIKGQSLFNSERYPTNATFVTLKTPPTGTNSRSSGTILSPICLDTPPGTPAKPPPMRDRIPVLQRPKTPKLPHQKHVKTAAPVIIPQEHDSELVRQLKAATFITKKEFDIDQEDLQRAIFGEVLGSEDEDQRKEKELQAKREQRLREKERRKQQALREAEENAQKEHEEKALAKQFAEHRRLQKEREELRKKSKRDEMRKKLAIDEEFATDQRRKAAAEKILKSRAKEAADKEAKELERKRLAAIQSEKDAREALGRKKAEAKEQAASIRQYSLSRGGHAPLQEKQKQVVNPLFLGTGSGNPKDLGNKDTTETFTKAGEEWKGRYKLQEEREAFEQKILLERVESSRNKMAVLYPNKLATEPKRKKRLASKSKAEPQKKPRTESRVLTQDEDDMGNDDGLPSVVLKSSPYSSRVEKPKVESYTKKRAGNELFSENATKDLKLDNEAFKATFISRKVQATIASGQALTTKLYQQFQREASVELTKNNLPLELQVESIKETLKEPRKQKRPLTKKPKNTRAGTSCTIFDTVVSSSANSSSPTEIPTVPISQKSIHVVSKAQPAASQCFPIKPLAATQPKPKSKFKRKPSAKLNNTPKEILLTPEDIAQKEKQDNIAAACLRLEEDRRDVLTINFGYNEAPCVDDDSEESNEDEDDDMRGKHISVQKSKQDDAKDVGNYLNSSSDISEITSSLFSENTGTHTETQSSDDGDYDLERALEEELLKELSNTKVTHTVQKQKPPPKKTNSVIRVYKVLLIRTSPLPVKISNANANISESESENEKATSDEGLSPIPETKVLKEFLSYNLANAHAHRSFKNQKRKTGSRLGISESSPNGLFHGKITYIEGQATQIKLEAETILASKFPGYDENKMDYRFTPTVYFMMLVLVTERNDESGQKIRESIEKNIGKHCTDRHMINNSAAEEFIKFVRPMAETIDNITHHDEVRKAVRDHRDIVNGEENGLLEISLDIDNESLPWMMEQGYVAISIEVRKSELDGPLN